MASIVDVAQRAQVSWNTVSRVINNNPKVRPPVRRAVLQAIEELGYVPNAAARGLRNSRTRTIGLVVSNLRDPVFGDIVTGVERVVSSRGYSLLVCDSWGGREHQARTLRTLFERRVEGLLYYPSDGETAELELFVQAKTPVLIMDWTEPLLDLPCLPVDHRAGIKAAVEYLMTLGHRRVGFMTVVGTFGEWRAVEIRDALLENGCSYDPSLVALVSSRREYGPAIRALLAHPNPPTALLAASPTLIPPILREIRAVGLKVPADISFVTLGDAPWTDVCQPPLTAVATDRFARGRAGANYIFARLSGSEGREFLSTWQPTLIIRDSCAPPPQIGRRPRHRAL